MHLDREEENIKWYRSNRYLRGISQDELEERIFDIINNMMRVSADGMVVPLSGFGENGEWMCKFIHCMEEFNIAFGDYRQNISKNKERNILPFDDARRNRIMRAATHFKGVTKKALFRFGSLPNMQDLFYQGNLLLQPASRFLHEDLSAVKDDECIISVSGILRNAEEVRKLVVNPVDVPNQIPEQQVKISFEVENYAIYCMGTEPELRMIADWDAKAAVIIDHPQDFELRLRNAVLKSFPESHISIRDVSYLDPYYPPERVPDVCEVKHFRYSYQKERRLIAHGCNVGTGFLVNVGPITDIATLVPLE